MYRCPKLPENTLFTALPAKMPNAPQNILEAPNHSVLAVQPTNATVVRVLITAFMKPSAQTVDGTTGK